MRLTVALALTFAAPAHAWEFAADPVCTLSHETSGASISVTFDPRRTEPYSIAVTRSAPWPTEPVFGIRYEGARALTITTNRHVMSDGGRTVTVRDRGFGNVLNGLEFNATATAFLGETDLSFTLEGAADPVRAFRACATPPSA